MKRQRIIKPNAIKPVATSRSFVISVVRYDALDGFGGYLSNSIKEGDGVILLNVEGTIQACTENDISIKEAMISTLMHEVGHALEDWYDVEFSEDRMERIVEEYYREDSSAD